MRDLVAPVLRLVGVSTVSVPADPPIGHRERLLAAAARFTAEHGWAALTMGRLAELGGVSRQTVYNEIGGKPQLAEAMVMRELLLFLDVVDSAFNDHPDELISAIETAARRALELAQTDPLVRMVLSASQGADTSDLLPLLTTNSEALLATAGQLVRTRAATYDVPLSEQRLETMVDMVIRLVLSHVMQPGGDPSEIAEAIAWIATRVLAGAAES